MKPSALLHPASVRACAGVGGRLVTHGEPVVNAVRSGTFKWLPHEMLAWHASAIRNPSRDETSTEAGDVACAGGR